MSARLTLMTLVGVNFLFIIYHIEWVDVYDVHQNLCFVW